MFRGSDEADAATADRSFPGAALPESLRGAVPKRQADYLAGRYCAREALRICAPEHVDTAIGVGPQREPLWPAGVVGAITHTRELASVAVARVNDARALGLDVELYMSSEQAAGLHEMIATRAELAALARATGWDEATTLTLVFSAKETIFKCLHAEVGRYFDFLDAAVVAIDPSEGRFAARLVNGLTPRLPAGYALEGRFERDARRVFTAMVLARV